MTYPAAALDPHSPAHTLSHSHLELRPLSHSLPLSNPLSNLAYLKNLSVDFGVKPSLKVITPDPLVLIQEMLSNCSNVASFAWI